MIGVDSYAEKIQEALRRAEVTDEKGSLLSLDEGLARWCEKASEVARSGAMLYFIGNGASAMMASHMSADATKNAGIRSIAFNDPAFLTAISNDDSFEQSFAMPITRLGRSGDMLVGISSSGNSPNILAAIKAARKTGLFVVTLSGMSADSRARSLGDLNLYVPADTYGIVECCHQTVLHCWLDMFADLPK